jgi:hypothetical protein
LLIWCSASSRTVAPHRIDSRKRATLIGGITSSDAGAGENAHRAADRRGRVAVQSADVMEPDVGVLYAVSRAGVGTHRGADTHAAPMCPAGQLTGLSFMASFSAVHGARAGGPVPRPRGRSDESIRAACREPPTGTGQDSAYGGTTRLTRWSRATRWPTRCCVSKPLCRPSLADGT